MTSTTLRWDSVASFQAWSTASEPYATAVLLSPLIAIPSDCTEIIPSWEASTPKDSAIEIRLRVKYADHESNWYRIALWDSAGQGSRRTSFASQSDDDAYVATDTLVLRRPAEAVQVAVALFSAPDGALPQLKGLSLSCSGDVVQPDAKAAHPVCSLEPPYFSQFSYDEQDGWCSPTSLAMVLGYWYKRTGDPVLAPFIDPQSVPRLVAPAVYDATYEGYGNWSFNVAYAASLGLESFVTRLDSIDQLDEWLALGIPVVMSIAWKEGQLTGAPIPKSNGHLIVAIGIDESGDVIVADPAAKQLDQVRRTYKRKELEACWLRPHGTIYLIYPRNYPIPQVGALVQVV
jgi:hypothetical protein